MLSERLFNHIVIDFSGHVSRLYSFRFNFEGKYLTLSCSNGAMLQKFSMEIARNGKKVLALPGLPK